MTARLIAALAMAAAAVTAYWSAYHHGHKAGQALVQQAWDRAAAAQALRTAETTIQYRQTEQQLQASAAAAAQKAKNEKRAIAGRYAADLERLRNRPELRATAQPGATPIAASADVGCTGAGLARPDAAFLAGYAADAARLAADYQRCTAAYDQAVNAIASHLQ